MDNNELENLECFIITKDFTLEENEEVQFFNFYDIETSNNYNLLLKNNTLFVCIRVNHFGSLFFGNFLFQDPMNIIVKEIDPLFIIIKIIHCSTYNNGIYKSSDIHNILLTYMEKLSNYKEADSENCSEFIKIYLNDYIETRRNEINKICEMEENSFTNSTYYKLCISKVLGYLNNKLMMLNECVTEEMDDGLNQEKIKNLVLCLKPYLPLNIYNELVNFKNLKDCKNENTSNTTNMTYKRKKSNELEKSQKMKKTNVKKNITPEKGQKTLTSFFKK